MNIEIINKIKSRMAGELLPEQLNIQYGEPRDVKNRGFTANLNKRQRPSYRKQRRPTNGKYNLCRNRCPQGHLQLVQF